MAEEDHSPHRSEPPTQSPPNLRTSRTLPFEAGIRDRQKEYDAALGKSDKSGNSTPFIEFILTALHQALASFPAADLTDQDTDQDTDQVKTLLKALGNHTCSAVELMERLNLKHRPTFRQNYLNPALAAGLIERSIPNKPQSRNQKYRKTRP